MLKIYFKNTRNLKGLGKDQSSLKTSEYEENIIIYCDTNFFTEVTIKELIENRIDTTIHYIILIIILYRSYTNV